MSIKQQETGPTVSYEDQLKLLIKSRKQIVQKMSHLTKKRYFLQAEPKAKQNADEAQQHEGQPRKMVKIESKQSIEAGVDGETPKKQSQRIRSSSSLPNEEQQTQSIKKMRQQNTMRSKKMFQGLVSHLDKAKSKLQQEKTKRQQTNKIYQKIQQRQKQKSQQLLREQLQRINNQFIEQQRLKNQNSKQILKIQNLILLKSYTQYANSIRPFAFTSTQPSISWKPATNTGLEIEKLAKKLLNKREQEIEQKNKKIIQSIQKYENKFEYGSYFLENEKQYYQNYIKSYYLQTNKFIRTETQPSVLWKPVRDFDKSQALLSSSLKKIEELIGTNKQLCDEHYAEKASLIKQKKEKGHHFAEEGDSHEQTPHKQEQD